MSKPPALSLTQDPIPQLTWRIALPMSVGMFFNTMFNVVDTLCAGWIGTDALASLSLSFPVFVIIWAVGAGLSQGATALMGNALGGGRPDEARAVLAQALLMTVVTGVLLTVAGWLAAPALFQLLGAEGAYLDTVLAFMNVILGGSTFILLPMILNAALSSQGETKPYRNFLIVALAGNVSLNPVFIWGWFGLPAMGVAGIALATVLVHIGGVIYLSKKVRRFDFAHGIGRADLRPDFALMRRIMGQALPAGMNSMTVAIGIVLITWFVKQFGKEAVAAYGIAVRIEQIVLLPTIGLNMAVLSIVSQNFGAGLGHRVKEAWSRNVLWGAGMMVAGGVLIVFLREPAMALFTKDPTVIRYGADYLLTASITLSAYPILFATMSALQGIKKPAFSFWIGLYRQILAPFAMFNLLAFTLSWKLWGVWWGICIVTWSAALFTLWWGNRSLNRSMSRAD